MEDKVGEFQAHFEMHKNQIRSFAGCEELRLLRDKQVPHCFFTFSRWESEAHLDAYRHSAIFKEVWAYTKARFALKPEAWSMDQLEQL